VPHQAICISRSTGAEGEAVGRAVAERLGFRYVDDEVIEEAAKSAGVDRELVADAEQRKPLAVRILAHIGEQSPETLALLPATGPESLPREEDLRLLIIDVLRSLADAGSVVIVAHAASFASGSGHGINRDANRTGGEGQGGRLAHRREDREARRR
jgi:Cytidylate kinase-like family